MKREPLSPVKRHVDHASTVSGILSSILGPNLAGSDNVTPTQYGVGRVTGGCTMSLLLCVMGYIDRHGLLAPNGGVHKKVFPKPRPVRKQVPAVLPGQAAPVVAEAPPEVAVNAMSPPSSAVYFGQGGTPGSPSFLNGLPGKSAQAPSKLQSPAPLRTSTGVGVVAGLPRSPAVVAGAAAYSASPFSREGLSAGMEFSAVPPDSASTSGQPSSSGSSSARRGKKRAAPVVEPKNLRPRNVKPKIAA